MYIEIRQQRTFVSDAGISWQSSRPTLVLLHGAGMDHTIWVLLGRYFARRGYNVVAPDLPAHGASEGRALDTISAMATWLWELLDALSVALPLAREALYFAGHSMGSLVLLEAAAARSTRINTLLLLGSGYPMPVGEALLNAAKNNQRAAIDMITLHAHSFASRLGHNLLGGISVRNNSAALLARAAPGVLFADLDACNEFTDGEAHARILRDVVQNVVIAGKDDQMTPLKASRRLQEMLCGDLQRLDCCGHMMMSEQPESTLLAMKTFLPSA